MTQPLLQPNHLSHTGAFLPAGRASFAVSSSCRMGLAHSFLSRSGIRAARSFQPKQQLRRQAIADLLHRPVLSFSASSSARRKARKAFHDGEKASHESGQPYHEKSHV